MADFFNNPKTFADAVNNGSWLKANFPEKDWHKHARGQSGDTQWCDGTPSDCAEKARL